MAIVCQCCQQTSIPSLDPAKQEDLFPSAIGGSYFYYLSTSYFPSQSWPRPCPLLGLMEPPYHILIIDLDLVLLVLQLFEKVVGLCPLQWLRSEFQQRLWVHGVVDGVIVLFLTVCRGQKDKGQRPQRLFTRPHVIWRYGEGLDLEHEKRNEARLEKM